MGTISFSSVKDGPLRPESAAVRVSSTKKERPSKQENNVSKVSEAAAQKAAAAQEAVKATFDMQELEATVSDTNKAMQSMDRSLNFSVDAGTERIVVRVIDDSTGEMIRQIPAEEMLRLAAHFKEMLDADQNSAGSTPIMLSVRT